MRKLSLSTCYVVAILSLAGCAGSDDEDRASATGTPTATPAPSVAPTGTPGPVPTPSAVTFAWIRTNVVEASCNGSSCHGATSDASLLEYTDVVNAPTHEGPYCDGRIRVVPGDLEASTFYLKLLDPPPCGERMPDDLPPLPDETIEQIKEWILAGAPEGEPAAP